MPRPKNDPRITQQAVAQAFSYCPDTGEIRWTSGRIAGCIDKSTGYRVVKFRRRMQYAHRLIWLLLYGEWPAGEIDHINRDRTDNRAANLRTATRAENMVNRRRWRSGLPIGVQARGSGFRAQITHNGKTTNLGQFPTKEAASAAFSLAESKLRPDCFRH